LRVSTHARNIYLSNTNLPKKSQILLKVDGSDAAIHCITFFSFFQHRLWLAWNN
jgi:hypothetical protein